MSTFTAKENFILNPLTTNHGKISENKVLVHQSKRGVQPKEDSHLVTANTFIFGSLQYSNRVLPVQLTSTEKSSELHVCSANMAELQRDIAPSKCAVGVKPSAGHSIW